MHSRAWGKCEEEQCWFSVLWYWFLNTSMCHCFAWRAHSFAIAILLLTTACRFSLGIIYLSCFSFLPHMCLLFVTLSSQLSNTTPALWPFQFNALSGKLARCPRCRKVSSVGSYARRRGGVFLAAGLIVLAIALGVTFGTFEFAKSTHGVYVVYVGKAGMGGMGVVHRAVPLLNLILGGGGGGGLQKPRFLAFHCVSDCALKKCNRGASRSTFWETCRTFF